MKGHYTEEGGYRVLGVPALVAFSPGDQRPFAVLKPSEEALSRQVDNIRALKHTQQGHNGFGSTPFRGFGKTRSRESQDLMSDNGTGSFVLDHNDNEMDIGVPRIDVEDLCNSPRNNIRDRTKDFGGVVDGSDASSQMSNGFTPAMQLDGIVAYNDKRNSTDMIRIPVHLSASNGTIKADNHSRKTLQVIGMGKLNGLHKTLGLHRVKTPSESEFSEEESSLSGQSSDGSAILKGNKIIVANGNNNNNFVLRTSANKKSAYLATKAKGVDKLVIPENSGLPTDNVMWTLYYLYKLPGWFCLN